MTTNSAPSSQFIESFIKSANDFKEKYSTESIIQFGDKCIKLSVCESEIVGRLINEAFITSKNRDAEFKLDIWHNKDKIKLSNSDFIDQFKTLDRIIPFEKTNPFRVCIDNSQGIIYVYDITKNHGYIWLIDLAKLNLNSFVTPFRIMLSWMANSFEGEIIHGSSILIKDKAVLLNGPSGSGKSSLALYCHLKGFPMIADDVVLYVNKKIYGVYRYSKYDKENAYFGSLKSDSQEQYDNGFGKMIYSLTTNEFDITKGYDCIALIYPIISQMSHWERVDKDTAARLLIPNSLREILGGIPKNHIRLRRIINENINYRLALSEDYERNLQKLIEIREDSNV